jgi:hypothetical protein
MQSAYARHQMQSPQSPQQYPQQQYRQQLPPQQAPVRMAQASRFVPARQFVAGRLSPHMQRQQPPPMVQQARARYQPPLQPQQYARGPQGGQQQQMQASASPVVLSSSNDGALVPASSSAPVVITDGLFLHRKMDASLLRLLQGSPRTILDKAGPILAQREWLINSNQARVSHTHGLAAPARRPAERPVMDKLAGAC